MAARASHAALGTLAPYARCNALEGRAQFAPVTARAIRGLMVTALVRASLMQETDIGMVYRVACV